LTGNDARAVKLHRFEAVYLINLLRLKLKHTAVLLLPFMRKWILFVMAICYLASSSGVAVQWHYCMGKLRSMDLGVSTPGETCSKCGMNKGENHCCNDAVSISKVTDVHQQSDLIAFNFFPAASPEPAYWSEVNQSLQFAPASIAHKIYPPPVFQNNRTILFCVFRC